MLKFGITNLDKLKNKKNFFGFLGGEKKISITLYKDITELPDTDKLAERILLVFSDERGAYKRTYQKRFEIFDEHAVEVLKEAFLNSEPLMFHDVGVSDGRTALDFFQKIQKVFPFIDYLASDYSSSVNFIKKGRIGVTLSSTGNLLEILFPPFVFNKTRGDSILYPLNHLIRFFLEMIFVRPLLKQYKQGLIQPKELLLFAPKVLEQAHKDKRFTLERHDLLKSMNNSFHAIRAMNILNPSYFSEKEFSIVINNIYQGLKKDGLLITGSNQGAGSIVHGGIYRKNNHGFEKLFQSGNGSPIESLLLSRRELTDI